MPLSFCGFISNLDQSLSWISDAWSVKLTFSLTLTFYLTKTENRTQTNSNKLKLTFCKKMLTSTEIVGPDTKG